VILIYVIDTTQDYTACSHIVCAFGPSDSERTNVCDPIFIPVELYVLDCTNVTNLLAERYVYGSAELYVRFEEMRSPLSFNHTIESRSQILRLCILIISYIPRSFINCILLRQMMEFHVQCRIDELNLFVIFSNLIHVLNIHGDSSC